MVRRVTALLVFGGLLASSAVAIAQVEDDRVKILLERITGDGPILFGTKFASEFSFILPQLWHEICATSDSRD